jgi:RNA recognition motif-containing protein
MASDSNSTSSSSSSSSSSSDDGSEVRHDQADDIEGSTKNHGDTVHDDECKVFLSRIPQSFNEDSIKRILHEKFGDGCVVVVSLVSTKEDETEANNVTEKKEHRGFGFVTFSSKEICQETLKCGTVRGSAKESSKRKHTLYIQRVVRDEYTESNGPSESNAGKDICFLWKKFRCPYGDDCKFVHDGEGGCNIEAADEKKSKVQKCFSFKKRGKCKLGDKCPFSHDTCSNNESKAADTSIEVVANAKNKTDNLKDCINWKTKGKCRKGDKCPYRHDESVRLKALSKKDTSVNSTDGMTKTKRKLQDRQSKVKQSLSIRVFGLNYSTTKEDVQNFFSHCGKIVEITFPTYEDSGRSKGYCGILFASPKAVQKAVEEMNGCELHGRWLSVQEGKMFLRKWEENEKVKRGDVEGGHENRGGKTEDEPRIGEFGQKVKKRKKHGFSD